MHFCYWSVVVGVAKFSLQPIGLAGVKLNELVVLSNKNYNNNNSYYYYYYYYLMIWQYDTSGCSCSISKITQELSM